MLGEGRSVYTVGRIQPQGVVLPVKVLILGAVHKSAQGTPHRDTHLGLQILGKTHLSFGRCEIPGKAIAIIMGTAGGSQRGCRLNGGHGRHLLSSVTVHAGSGGLDWSVGLLLVPIVTIEIGACSRQTAGKIDEMQAAI